MEEILSLFNRVLSPDANSASEALIEFYKTPSNAEILFAILNKQKESSSIRTLAALGIKSVTENDFNYVKTEMSGILFHAILFEKNDSVLSILLDSVSIIIENIDVQTWTELIEFVQSIIESTQNRQFHLFLTLFKAIAPKVSVETNSSLFELMNTKIAQNALVLDEENQVALLDLYSTLFDVIEVPDAIVIETFSKIFELFKNNLLSDEVLKVTKINDSIRNFLRSETKRVVDLREILTEMLEIFQNDEIPIQQRTPLFQIVTTIIEIDGDIIHECGSVLVNLGIILNSLVMELEDYNEDDSLVFTDFLETVCLECPGSDFYEVFSECTQNEVVSNKSACISLASVTDIIPNVIRWHFNEIFEFLITCIEEEDIGSKKAALSLLNSLIKDFYNELTDYCEVIVTHIMSVIEIDDNELIMMALNSFISLLSSVDINTNMIEPIVTALLTLLENITEDFDYLVIECLGSLCKTTLNAMQPFSPQLYSIFLDRITQTDLKSQTLLKSNAIEAMGSLFRGCATFSSEELDQVLAVLNELIHVEEYELFDCCSYSLGVMSKNYSFDISPFLDVVDAALNEKRKEFGNMKLAKNSLKFLNCVAKNFPDQVGPHIEHFYPIIEELLESESNSTRNLSMKVLIKFCIIQGSVFDPFSDKLCQMIESGNFELVFNCFRKIVSKLSLPKEKENFIVQSILEIVSYDSEADENAKDAGFYAIAEFGKIKKEEFPTDAMWEILSKYNDEGDKRDDLMSCIGVFADIFEVFSNEMPEETKEQFCLIFFPSLQFCDCEVTPHPLIGAQRFLEHKFQPTQECVQSAVDFATALFEKEYEGESFYYETVSGTISLLFTLFANFDVEWSIVSYFIPKMIEFSDRKLLQANVNTMFVSAINTCYKFGPLLERMSADIISFFVNFLIISEQKWNYLNISNETVDAVVTYIAASIEINGGCNEFVLSVVGDEIAKERVRIRSNGRLLSE